jgi:hypothetical protein
VDRFSIRNLPPGENFVAATTGVAEGEWFDVSLVGQFAAASPV